jgi:GT2 family glycosyltransferase
MDLSIVIVNYNVKYFLEQCLHSVKKATEGIAAEVFVVDNNSVDGSCSHIREKFPWVHLIENHENVGFSRANNQAIRKASGRYILLLNPDTVVEENTFSSSIHFMDDHPDAGALGVRMIDGKGRFLPESKRSLPTPWVAFYKIFGLASLFPGSKRFGRYHLGYLDPDEVHEVEVLAGAFMFLRKEVLDKVGLLDEDYFMYGEDIDLSYRIIKGGYKNYYFPGTTIIHYKGESTKKGSMNYVMVFYNAMIIFARKHFTSRNARAYAFIINTAIYLRAFLSLVKRAFRYVYRQLVDALLIMAGFLIGLPVWEKVRFGQSDHYPDEFLFFVVPGYILIWLVSAFYSGGYDKPVKLWSLVRGILLGTLIILVVYALLPDTWRFSRALILMGTVWTLLVTTGTRYLLHLLGVEDFKLDLKKRKRMVIVGEQSEADRVSDLLKKTQIKPEIIGYVSPDESIPPSFLGAIQQIDEIVRIHRLDEIVFCAKNLSSQKIIRWMTRLTNVPVNYKIAPPESLSIIGSNSINTAGELYTIHFNSVGKRSNLRTKRLFDVTASIVLILSFPVWLVFIRSPFRAFSRLIMVLTGMRTMVGYHTYEGFDPEALPLLRPGLLTPGINIDEEQIPAETASALNILYAKDYRLMNDLVVLWRKFPQLGKKRNDS